MKPVSSQYRATLAALSLCFIIAACSGGSGGGGSNGGSNPTPSEQPTTEFVQNQPSAATPIEPASSGDVTVSLSWTLPTTRENGAVLLPSEIAKYEIYYVNEAQGDNPDCCMLTINNPTQTSAQISIASSGTYFFSIVAYDTDLNASQMSEPVAMTF